VKTALVMLAVTHMKTGICIAGVNPDAPANWVRPVREFGTILLGDITYPAPPAASIPAGQRRAMRPFDVAELGLGHARPAPPHIEDWTCDFAHQRPRLLGVLPEGQRAALLDAASHPAQTLWGGERSLGIVVAEQLSATFRHDRYTGKYDARLSFAGLPPDATSAACTDLKWRALGRRLLANGVAGAGAGAPALRTLTLAGDELSAALGGATQVWLALGISRALDGRFWPLVIGVHTLPDYEVEIDYSTL
jgi:hypothetical protein